MTSGANAAEKSITLPDGNFTITFDTAATSGKCGYYNTTTKRWTDKGTLSTKTCTFTHLTDFAIYNVFACPSKCLSCISYDCTSCILGYYIYKGSCI